MEMKKDFLVFCITLLATFLLGVFLENRYSLVSLLKPSPAQKLTAIMKADFSKLQKQGRLPEEWNHIGTFSFINKSSLQNMDSDSMERAFIQQQDGTYHLESILTDWSKNKKHYFVLQLSLIEMSSKNKIWEFGRTYSLLYKGSSLSPQAQVEDSSEGK